MRGRFRDFDDADFETMMFIAAGSVRAQDEGEGEGEGWTNGSQSRKVVTGVSLCIQSTQASRSAQDRSLEDHPRTESVKRRKHLEG